MHYVYHIQSLSYPEKHHTGFSSDLKQRIKSRNEGSCDYTRPYRPWKLLWHSAFEEEQKARDFEKYLKSGSGHAFAKKRLW